MEKLSLGGTTVLCGREVPRIGYGMGQVARTAASGARDEAISLLRHAFDLGVRLFDTAQFYESGLANALIREALGEHRDEITIATKAGARPIEGPIPMTAAQRPEELRQAVEDNLASLGTDHLDLVYVRRMDFTPGLVAEGEQQVPLADQLAEMVALRDAGKVRGIGLSHVTREQVDAAVGADVQAVQNIYNLLGRQDEQVMRGCSERGVAWIPYFPLGGGGYAGLPKVVDDPVVQAVAGELGVPASQVGLAWQLAHNPTTMLIPGTSSIEHLEQNVTVGDLQLTADQLARLDAVGGPDARGQR